VHPLGFNACFTRIVNSESVSILYLIIFLFALTTSETLAPLIYSEGTYINPAYPIVTSTSVKLDGCTLIFSSFPYITIVCFTNWSVIVNVFSEIIPLCSFKQRSFLKAYMWSVISSHGDRDGVSDTPSWSLKAITIWYVFYASKSLASNTLSLLTMCEVNNGSEKCSYFLKIIILVSGFPLIITLSLSWFYEDTLYSIVCSYPSALGIENSPYNSVFPNISDGRDLIHSLSWIYNTGTRKVWS